MGEAFVLRSAQPHGLVVPPALLTAKRPTQLCPPGWFPPDVAKLGTPCDQPEACAAASFSDGMGGDGALKLYVVRHAQVAVQPHVRPEEWQLSEEGIAAAQMLARRSEWADVELAAVYHSPQRKTAQTAAAISGVLGIPALADEDLSELRMDCGFLGTAEFERRVGRYLEGGRDPAFEDYGRAQERVVGCVRRILSANGDGSIAIVSHGRILTVLFSALCGVRLGSSEWRSIRMPDLSVVDLDEEVVTQGFFAGRRIRAAVVRG